MTLTSAMMIMAGVRKGVKINLAHIFVSRYIYIDR